MGFSLARFWRAFRIWEAGFEHPIPPRYATDLHAQLNHISILLALVGAHYILHVSRIKVKEHFNTLSAQLTPSVFCWHY